MTEASRCSSEERHSYFRILTSWLVTSVLGLINQMNKTRRNVHDKTKEKIQREVSQRLFQKECVYNRLLQKREFNYDYKNLPRVRTLCVLQLYTCKILYCLKDTCTSISTSTSTSSSRIYLVPSNTVLIIRLNSPSISPTAKQIITLTRR